MQVGEALAQARRLLKPMSETPASDARLLLADAIGRSTAWILANDHVDLPPGAEHAFEERLGRCAAGESLPYVLGWWEFYGRRFSVDGRVLIPRPETELTVELALAELSRRRTPVSVIDVGTGSGCIAVTLAAEQPVHSFVASDVSRSALEVARMNAAAHEVSNRVRFVQCHLLEGLRCEWDIVCANLPYIPADRLPGLAVSQCEPGLALNGGRDGMALTVPLIRSLGRALARAGLALIEIDEDQGDSLAEVARQAVAGSSVECATDLAGRRRVLVIRRGPHAE